MESVGMQEYEDAKAFIKTRLDPEWAQKLSEGDFGANLLHYLRTREHSRLLFDPARLATIAELAEKHDPEEAAWEREIAENAVEGRLYGASNAYCRRFLSLDRDNFDFSQNDVHEDPQAIHGLGRQRWLASLMYTYWHSPERKYFDALLREWNFFCAKVPFPEEDFYARINGGSDIVLKPPYGQLDINIRLTNWYWGFWLSVFAEEMTGDVCTVLLARCLKQFDLVAACGIGQQKHNFTAMQQESLFLWACALPEFIGMSVWLHNARNNLVNSQRHAVFADGVHWEKAAGYHDGCIRWYATSAFLAQRNNLPWAPYALEMLQKMGEFSDAIITPDGNTSLIGDADRVPNWTQSLPLLRSLFPDLKFRRLVAPSFYSLWKSNGTEWEPESVVAQKPLVSVFPEGGVGVVRTSQAVNAHYLLMDNGPKSAAHAHNHNLTVSWDVFGKPAIVDPGRWRYDKSPDRVWALSAESHNTTVPELEMFRSFDNMANDTILPVPTPEDPRLGDITVTEETDKFILQSFFRSFAIDTMAQVTRTAYVGRDEENPWLLILDRVEGTREYAWTSSFLLPAPIPLEPQKEQVWKVCLENGVMLSVAATAENGQLACADEARFWCPEYSEKNPAQWVRFSNAEQSGRRAFGFICAPGKDPVLSSVQLDGENVRFTLGGELVCWDKLD